MYCRCLCRCEAHPNVYQPMPNFQPCLPPCSAHCLAHLTAAVGLLLLLELGTETVMRYEHVGRQVRLELPVLW